MIKAFPSLQLWIHGAKGWFALLVAGMCLDLHHSVAWKHLKRAHSCRQTYRQTYLQKSVIFASRGRQKRIKTAGEGSNLKPQNRSGLHLYLWRGQWQPTPVLLPGKSHGRRSLGGCSPWGREESDTTERLHVHFSLSCIGEGNGNPLQCSCLEGTAEPGGLPSMESHRFGHDRSDLAAAAAPVSGLP